MILLVNKKKVVAAALLFAAVFSGAQELSLSSHTAYNAGTETTDTATVVHAEGKAFELFAGVESANRYSDSSVNARGEASGKVSVWGFSVLAGNLSKPSALTRLENPVFTDYTNALSHISAPATGVKSGVPSSLGSHPEAAAVQLALPRFDFSAAGALVPRVDSAFTEYYYDDANGIHGARGTAHLSFNTGALFNAGAKTTAQLTAGWYSYKLSPKEETTWFLSVPYFAAGDFSSFLVEALVRAPLFKKSQPVVLFAAAGIPESPFGGFSPWTRAELGFPLPLGGTMLTLKGKIFYAEHDFYTPKNSLVAGRVKAAGNISYSFFAACVLAVRIGTAFGYDSHTELYKTRAGISFAAGATTLAFNGQFSGWKITDRIIASSDTVVGTSASLTHIFSRIKPEISASMKWYPGKLWQSEKKEYSAGISVTPRNSSQVRTASAHSQRSVSWDNLIPAAHLRYDATMSAALRYKSTLFSSASWKFKTKNVRLSAKIETRFPLE